MKISAALLLAMSLTPLLAQSPSPGSVTPTTKLSASPTPPPAPAKAPAGITRLSLPSGSPWVAGTDEKENDPDAPSLDLYLVKSDKPTTAIVILPGGGYRSLSMAWEGSLTASFMNKFGVSAFVVRYRHAPRFKYPAPLQDAQTAIRFVRAHAAEYNVAPDRIGIIGYSAGGHLASMTLTRFDAGNPQATDSLDRLSSRPDFGLLVYPVITLTADPFVHAGSRSNLLGDDKTLYAELSSELHVRQDSPPAFLVSGGTDKTVPYENSLLYYQACRKAGVPAELHLYEDGGHGLKEPNHQAWHEWAGDWMFRNGWIEKPAPQRD